MNDGLVFLLGFGVLFDDGPYWGLIGALLGIVGGLLGISWGMFDGVFCLLGAGS